MTAYYNEIEPFAAQWLRNLIDAGHIAPGVVDERDIRDVTPNDLRGFTQCHFFAGIGIWSYALRRAGWPDDRPVWTGSCPCQPFSAAGRRGGVADERHLWPHWHHLIEQSRPTGVLGEQVASKDGLLWLDLVSADLEGSGYSFGASDLCAAGFGGAHIRQRLYFVGLAESESVSGGTGLRNLGQGEDARKRIAVDSHGSAVCRMGNADRPRTALGISESSQRQEGITEVYDDRSDRLFRSDAGRPFPGILGSERRASAFEGFWRDCDWLFCRDGKWRPVESGTFPLVDASSPFLAGRRAEDNSPRGKALTAIGNGLDAETAANFVAAVLQITPDDLI
jgi:DNA (cytosine-5)-methyltransferase 1